MINNIVFNGGRGRSVTCSTRARKQNAERVKTEKVTEIVQHTNKCMVGEREESREEVLCTIWHLPQHFEPISLNNRSNLKYKIYQKGGI